MVGGHHMSRPLHLQNDDATTCSLDLRMSRTVLRLKIKRSRMHVSPLEETSVQSVHIM